MPCPRCDALERVSRKIAGAFGDRRGRQRCEAAYGVECPSVTLGSLGIRPGRRPAFLWCPQDKLLPVTLSGRL